MNSVDQLFSSNQPSLDSLNLDAVEGSDDTVVLVSEGILEVSDVGQDLSGSLGRQVGSSVLDVLDELGSLGLDLSEGGLSDAGDLSYDLADLLGDLVPCLTSLIQEVSEEVADDSALLE